MKIKRLLHKEVRIKWRDPVGDRAAPHELPKGRAALATWWDYGVLLDDTEGILILAHGIAKQKDEIADIVYSAIPLSLVEQIKLLGDPRK